jgi:hypothetical protein
MPFILALIMAAALVMRIVLGCLLRLNGWRGGHLCTDCYFAARACRFLNGKANFQRPARKRTVVKWFDPAVNSFMQLVEYVGASWAALARRRQYLANAAVGVNENAVRRLPQISTATADDHCPEVWLVPTLARTGLPPSTAAIAEFIRSQSGFLGLIADCRKCTPCGAVIWNFRLTHLAYPAVELVAIEAVIATVNKAGRTTVFERQHSRTATLRRPSRVENASHRANMPDARITEQPRNIYLVRYLIK